MKKRNTSVRGWIVAVTLLLSLGLASCNLPFFGEGESAETGTDEITEATGEVTTEKVKKPINIKDQSTSTYEPETVAPAPTNTAEPTDTSAPTDTTTPTTTTEPYTPEPGPGERLPWADGTKE